MFLWVCSALDSLDRGLLHISALHDQWLVIIHWNFFIKKKRLWKEVCFGIGVCHERVVRCWITILQTTMKACGKGYCEIAHKFCDKELHSLYYSILRFSGWVHHWEFTRYHERLTMKWFKWSLKSAVLILINIVFSSLTKLWDIVHELFNIAQTKKIDWACISHVIV